MIELHIQTDLEREGKQVAARINRKDTCLMEVSLVIQELERAKLFLLSLEFDDDEDGEVYEYEQEK